MKRSDNKEFIKVGKNYLIKNSNGRIVSEKEKLELEKKELIIEDVKSECGKEASKKLKKVAGFDKDTVQRRTYLALIKELQTSFINECF